MRTVFVLAGLCALLIIMSCAKSKSVDLESECNKSDEICNYTPIATNPNLSSFELLKSKVFAYFKNKKATDKLIEYYAYHSDIPNTVYWCYKGAKIVTNRGIFCAAGFEVQQGGKANCTHVINLYRNLSMVDKNAAKVFMKSSGLKAEGANISCTGPLWD